MRKLITVILASVVSASIFLTACAQQKETGTTAETATEAAAMATETEQRSDMHDNEIIVMENFFVGYLIDDDEQFLKDAIADGYADNVISDVLTRGQRYHDDGSNANFAIIRKRGNENTMFDLPPSKVTVYDLRGLSYHDIAYDVSLNSFNASETVSTGYGDFELRYPEA